MMRGLFFAVLWCVSCGVLSVSAQGTAQLSDVERKQVNDWMAERAETMIQTHKLEGELLAAWSDTRYSSAEVDALRARYRELQVELTRTQQALEKKVMEIPAVKEKARQRDEAKAKTQELSKKIAEKTGEKK